MTVTVPFMHRFTPQEVGAADAGDWAFSGSYRPFEALALLEEMAAWMQ